MDLKKQGFSLIELLVIISIVGVLTAIAVPSFKAYRIKSIVGKQMEIMREVSNRVIQYYDDHGVFPQNSDVNLPETTLTGSSIDTYMFPPNIIDISVGNSDPGAPGCNSGSVTMYVSNYEGDITQTLNAPTTVITLHLFNENGVIKKYCSYLELIPGTGESLNREILPSCTKVSAEDLSDLYNVAYAQASAHCKRW